MTTAISSRLAFSLSLVFVLSSLVGGTLAVAHSNNRRHHHLLSKNLASRSNGWDGLYYFNNSYVGNDFFTQWTWEVQVDPTNGRVNYVDQNTAISRNLSYLTEYGSFVMKVDSESLLTDSTPRGRDSVRIHSNQAWEDSVIVIDVNHIPWGCATWPAFWTLSQHTLIDPKYWPQGGEVDIIEGVNLQLDNRVALHTTADCSMPAMSSIQQAGTTITANCDGSTNSQQGCATQFAKNNSYGQGFNNAGGGWFAMERNSAVGIRFWFFSRAELQSNLTSVPKSILQHVSSVDTSTWGVPQAQYPATQNCNFLTHFDPHMMIFDTTLCGDWAGPTAQACLPAGMTCADYVNKNPQGFDYAFWDINSIHVYTPYTPY